ncbi:MAG: low molecular weight phosphotyrosine protein phosphatase [Cyanobacteria bacterium]|nr:low molecular weight phosphotyrosine protein phosphatase [Cyanobacteriota bacterium]
MNILFVCLGNICRSPMAAGILHSLYRKRELQGQVDSAGTMDWNVGSGADSRALKVCLQEGIDIQKHRARQLTNDDFTHFEALIVMDSRIEKTVRSRRPPRQCAEIFRLTDFLPGRRITEIVDPYHDTEEAFRQTFSLLDLACNEIVDQLQKTGAIQVRN